MDFRVGVFFLTSCSLVLVVIYAMLYRGGSGIGGGARFGALIGVFAICAFVVHNYGNLNIGLKLTLNKDSPISWSGLSSAS